MMMMMMMMIYECVCMYVCMKGVLEILTHPQFELLKPKTRQERFKILYVVRCRSNDNFHMSAIWGKPLLCEQLVGNSGQITDNHAGEAVQALFSTFNETCVKWKINDNTSDNRWE